MHGHGSSPTQRLPANHNTEKENFYFKMSYQKEQISILYRDTKINRRKNHKYNNRFSAP